MTQDESLIPPPDGQDQEQETPLYQAPEGAPVPLPAPEEVSVAPPAPASEDTPTEPQSPALAPASIEPPYQAPPQAQSAPAYQTPVQAPSIPPYQPPVLGQPVAPYQPPVQEVPPTLRCKDLVKNYGVVPALSQVTFDVYPGRIIGLLGPNGSGKTTLIKTIAGLLTPTYGEVKICGYAPGVESKSLVSYLPERTYLGAWMKVSDAIDYFESFYADFSRERALDMLGRLQVPLSFQINKLSKGTQEKVQLILVMSRRARLYLLDEPIAGVDPAARDYIIDTIISNYDRNAAIIISTHLIADVEKTLDDFIFINRGQIVSFNSVSAVHEAGWPSLDAYFREAFRC